MNKDQLRTCDLCELNVEFGERPSMPALQNVTEAEHRAGLHLAAIHRMHLRDMQRLTHMLEQVEQGAVSPEVFAQEVSNVELTHNMRMFGTMCGRECQVLTFHHDAEEHMIFPQLEQQNIQALSRVVERLKQEHLIVHELITRLETAAQALVQNPDEHNLAKTKATFAQLHTVVISHFGYEETELRQALGRFVPVM
jgi:iron-sulfur cluster repair protein YtfE (RIC family)